MSTEILYHKVNGVLVPYWAHKFCPEGADGLVGADARILQLDYQHVDGEVVPYWSPDTCASKYLGDFPNEVPTEIFNANTTNFNGTNNLSVAGDITNGLTDMTIFTWVKLNSTTGGDERVFSTSTDTPTTSKTAMIVGRLGSEQAEFGYRDSNGGAFMSSGASPQLNVGEWYLLEGSLTSTGVHIRVNGTLESTGARGGNIYNSSFSNRMDIGALEQTVMNYAQHIDAQMHSMIIYGREATQAERDTIYNLGQARCWDLLLEETPTLSDALYAPPMYNHDGFVGKQGEDQSSSGLVWTNINGVTMDGSDQIECEQYTPTSPLWFKTKGVASISLSISDVNTDWASSGSNEGTIIDNNIANFTYPDTNIEYLVEATDIPTQATVANVDFQNDGVTRVGPLTGFLALRDLRFSGNPNLKSIDLAGLEAIDIRIWGWACDLTGHQVVPIAPSLPDIRLFNNPNLTSLSTLIGFNVLNYLDINSCGLTQVSVDQILNDIKANGVVGVSVNISGGTNATPSQSVIDDAIDYIENTLGGSVTYNP